jgi:hypothetical protein
VRNPMLLQHSLSFYSIYTWKTQSTNL